MNQPPTLDLPILVAVTLAWAGLAVWKHTWRLWRNR